MNTKYSAVVAGSLLLLFLATLASAAERPRPAEPGAEAVPRMVIRLGQAESSGTPGNEPHTRTGGGNVVVRQPAPDVVEITMTGTAITMGRLFAPSATGFRLTLTQSFTIADESTRPRPAVLLLQGYVLGLLRSPCKGSAGIEQASASVTRVGENGEEGPPLAFSLPPRGVGPGQNESVYLRSDPVCVPVPPRCYTLQQTFAVGASQPACGFPRYGAAADFSPARNVLDDTEHRNPFAGISKKDFGFHVILKVVPVATQEVLPRDEK